MEQLNQFPLPNGKSAIGQFPVEVSTLHVLFFPVTHKAGLLVSKETLFFFIFLFSFSFLFFLMCLVSLIAPFALLSAGGTCQSPALPALVRPPAPPLQPSLDIKPFLPFPLDTAAAVNLFPNFNAVSPIVKFAYTRVVSTGKPSRPGVSWSLLLFCYVVYLVIV